MFTLVHLDSYALIRVSKADAATFLQGQLSCDVHTLHSTHLSLGAYCNLKGRVMALFKLFLVGSDYYLQCPADLVDKAILKLKQHALFSNVLIDNAQWDTIGIIRENIEPLLARHPTLLPNLIILAVPNTETQQIPRWQLMAPSEIIQLLWGALTQEADVRIETPEYWTLLDIRAGIPEITSETSERFLAHHLNLPALNAISFTKGCYHGQEIIARMQYRAVIKKHMIHQVGNMEIDEKNIVISSLNEQGIIERLVIADK